MCGGAYFLHFNDWTLQSFKLEGVNFSPFNSAQQETEALLFSSVYLSERIHLHQSVEIDGIEQHRLRMGQPL
jgi:hypothetical protein